MIRAPLSTLDEIASGGKRLLARALAAIETHAGTSELATLLDEANARARAHVLGLTGPPGVGKSTLTNALVSRWRTRGETVGVIAVDPSSRRTGGALLGDRARLSTDPDDQGVFVRSMAARDRLGGLSDQTVAAMVLMRAVFDRVLIESVGIGQSEADISFAADTVLLCIQPGSGDSLQFMKAGVMELPDVVAVTKADMGAAARRAKADVAGALTLFDAGEGWTAPVELVSASSGEGLEDLERSLEQHRRWLENAGRLARQRAKQAESWIDEGIRSRYGTSGLALARRMDGGTGGPFARERILAEVLAKRLNDEFPT